MFYQSISLAAEQLTDTAGVRLNPTHVFSTSDFFRYVTRQVDNQQRPLLVPDSNALVSAKGEVEVNGLRLAARIAAGLKAKAALTG